MDELLGRLVKVILRRLAAGMASAAIGVLAILSIVGAFLRAGGAKRLFSSWPVAVFWLLLAVLLVAALALGRLRRGGAPVAVAHIGGLLVLIGGLAGSDKAHALAGSVLGNAKPPSGYVVLSKGEQSDMPLAKDLQTKTTKLSFALRLRQFRIEHYPPGDQRWNLVVRASMDRTGGLELAPQVVRWEFGQEIEIPFCDAKCKVLEYTPHARFIPPATIAADANSPTPAMRIELSRGELRRQVLLAPTEEQPRASVSVTEAFGLAGDVGLHLLPPPQRVKDYASEMEILEAGQVVGGGTIRVNSPLHHGGYHFYQYACGEEGGQFTVLMAVSDWGLIPAGAGGILLCMGVFWACWVHPAWSVLSGRKSRGDRA